MQQSKSKSMACMLFVSVSGPYSLVRTQAVALCVCVDRSVFTGCGLVCSQVMSVDGELLGGRKLQQVIRSAPEHAFGIWRGGGAPLRSATCELASG